MGWKTAFPWGGRQPFPVEIVPLWPEVALVADVVVVCAVEGSVSFTVKPVVDGIRMWIWRTEVGATQTPIRWFVGISECGCSVTYCSFGEVSSFLTRLILEIACASKLPRRLAQRQAHALPPPHLPCIVSVFDL